MFTKDDKLETKTAGMTCEHYVTEGILYLNSGLCNGLDCFINTLYIKSTSWD